MSTRQRLFVWSLLALRSTQVRSNHGLGRVNSVLYVQLSMLAATLADELSTNQN